MVCVIDVPPRIRGFTSARVSFVHLVSFSVPFRPFKFAQMALLFTSSRSDPGCNATLSVDDVIFGVSSDIRYKI